MGLFDDVRCDYPLPDPRHNELSFQTKDLDSDMNRYRVTEEGRLERYFCNWEDTGEEEWNAYFKRLVPKHRRVHERWVDYQYHGDLHIYDRDQERDEWVEYVLRFTEGAVSRLWRVNHDGTPFVAVEPSSGRGGYAAASPRQTNASKPEVTGGTKG